MDVLRWEAWYRGGQAYCSSGTQWEMMPDEGVLGVVVVFSDNTRRMVSGTDL